jgi:hypothetical protein
LSGKCFEAKTNVHPKMFALVFEFLPSFADVCSTLLIGSVLLMWIEKKENCEKS